MTDREYMSRALELARKAAGKTSPNPMVGAVLVKEGRIVGEGFHRQAGLPHAEIEAMKEAGENAKGAALYVNLEPCSHHGKTPPCAEALIRAGIRRVVVASSDPNPLVNGKGIEALRAAGIEVETGVLEAEARVLNEVFFKWIRTGYPFVVLKYAMTLDGKISTSSGDSKWITSDSSRERVHEMRSALDAILVGIDTVLRDDPLLTARVPNGKSPIRIVMDSNMRTPVSSRLMQTISEAPVWIAAGTENPEQRKALEEAGASVTVFPGGDGRVSPRRLCAYLGENNITSLLVEGGATVHGSFLREGLADKLAAFIAPKLIGNHGAAGPVEGWGVSSMREAVRLENITATRIDEDILIEGYFRSGGKISKLE